MRKNISNPQSKSVNATNLKKIHIIKRNLLYLSNIPKEITLNLLITSHFLGQYGKIQKSCIKSMKTNDECQNKNNFTALITFENENDASLAILALNEFKINNNILKASFGLTRYCSSFLHNKKCKSKKCYFLHHQPDQDDIICGKDNLLKDKNLNEENVILFLLKSKLKTFIFEFFKNEKNPVLKNENMFFPNKINSFIKIKNFLQNHPEILISTEIKNPIKNFKSENRNLLSHQNYLLNNQNFHNKTLNKLSNFKIKNETQIVKNKDDLKSQKEIRRKAVEEDSSFNHFNFNISFEKSQNKNFNYNYFKNNSNKIKSIEKSKIQLEFYSCNEKTNFNSKNNTNFLNNQKKSKLEICENKNFSNKKKTNFSKVKKICTKSKNAQIFSKNNEKVLNEKISKFNNNIFKDSDESTLDTTSSEQELSHSEIIFFKNLQKKIFCSKNVRKYKFVSKEISSETKPFWLKIDQIFSSENPWFIVNNVFFNNTL